MIWSCSACVVPSCPPDISRTIWKIAVAEVAFYTLVSTFTLAAVGGWFGGQLFPPVVRVPRRGSLESYG
jgi:hypothetical protein